jgi:dolichol kinase
MTLRRLLHASTAGILGVLMLGSWSAIRWSVTTIAALAVAVDTMRILVPAMHAWLAGWLPVFRPREARAWSGAAWLWVGYAIAIWMPAPAGAGAILATALADPTAATVGSYVGTAPKTWWGTGSHFFVGVACMSVLGWGMVPALAGAALGSTLERWPGPFNDNLVAPVGVAAALWVLA